MNRLIEKLKHRYQKYEKWFEVIIFVGGFLFDALFVQEPDELFAIFQQIMYLVIIGSILHFELLTHLQKWQPPTRFLKIWSYRELLQPFFLGTLLNVYSIFYIKSASFFSSLFFLLIMVGMILANENPKVKKSGISFKFGLFGICLFSFFSILFPILIGSLGLIPFSFAVLFTGLVFYAEFILINKKLGDLRKAVQAILIPGLSVLIFFLVFYGMGWIPPVPLSVKSQGIYHFVEKKEGQYWLSTEKEWWRFWNAGDERFKARSGDKVYFYIQIYSPARFEDKVMIHWLWKNPKGDWESMDKIPMHIAGGRKEGFRSYAVKNHFQPGEWRVQAETLSGVEISRHYFTVIASDEVGDRQFFILRR